MRRLFAALLLLGLFVPQDIAEPEPLMATPYDARMLTLDRLALDDAYRTQLTKLFGIWMADAHGQPQRAITGANRARSAYVAVMREIEARERQGSQP